MSSFMIYALQRLLLQREKKRRNADIGKHNLFVDKERAKGANGKGHSSSQ